MNVFEKIKRRYLTFAMDEPFDIFRIILDVEDSQEKDDGKWKDKTLECTKYFLESEDFVVGNLNPEAKDFFDKWECSTSECLSRIEKYWHEYESNKCALDDVWFDLTKKGRITATKLMLDEIHVEEKIYIDLDKKGLIDFGDIVKIVKNEFQTEDLEEIQYETMRVLKKFPLLIIGKFENGKFVPLSEKTQYSMEEKLAHFKKIEEEWKELGREPIKGELYFINGALISGLKKVIKKWEKSGKKRLFPYLYEWVDLYGSKDIK